MNFIYNYKAIIPLVIALIKLKKLNYRLVSNFTNIHASYFTRVIKGDAKFSQQQIFSILKIFDLSESEIDYAILLWQLDQAVSSDEQKYFKNKIEQKQKEVKQLKRRLNAKEIEPIQVTDTLVNYYDDPLTSIIHMFLTIDKFKNNSSLILEKIDIDKTTLQSELLKLNSLNLIRLKNDVITHVEDSVHLPQESIYSKRNHTNWRLKTIFNLQSSYKNSSDYNFSAIFTGDEKLKQSIQKAILDSIVEIGNQVEKCKNADEVYHLGFDLWEV